MVENKAINLFQTIECIQILMKKWCKRFVKTHFCKELWRGDNLAGSGSPSWRCWGQSKRGFFLKKTDMWKKKTFENKMTEFIFYSRKHKTVLRKQLVKKILLMKKSSKIYCSEDKMIFRNMTWIKKFIEWNVKDYLKNNICKYFWAKYGRVFRKLTKI